MFGDKKGLSAEVKFSVNSVYDAFSNKWNDFDHDKLSWIDTWSELLSTYSIKSINKALEHCINNLNRAPSAFEFRTYCQRHHNNQCMDTPIVSKQEENARRIIELSKEIGCETLSELQDACLIAASIAATKTNREVDIEWDENAIDIHFLSRARMFAYESVYWADDAENNKGYWADILKLPELK